MTPVPADSRYVPSTQIRIGIVATFTLQFLLLYHLNVTWSDAPSRWLVASYTVVTAMPIWLAITVSDARRWAAWVVALTTTALLAALGWFAGGRCAPALDVECGPVLAPYVLLLSPALLVAGVFVRSALVCGSGWRSWPDYHVLYREAWQVGLALVHAALVTGLAWLLLAISGQLFHLLGIDVVRALLGDERFVYGFTGFALGMGVAVWLSLVRAVESVRQIILGMAHLLMPLASVIVIGFTLAVLITGPANLFEAYEASWWMLGIATVVIVLYNGVFQDGETAPLSRGWSQVEFWIRHGAVSALVPILGLVAYGLGSRVLAYGWTVPRVYGAVFALFIALYVIGYLTALLCRRIQAGVQLTNRLLAVGFVVIVVVLLSPLMTPSGIAANSQLSRLESGATQLDDVDFHYLRHRSGMAGYRAWESLGNDPRVRQNEALLARWQHPTRRPLQTSAASDHELASLYSTWVGEVQPPQGLLESQVFRQAAARCVEQNCWLRPATIPSSPPTEIWILLRHEDANESERALVRGEIFQRALAHSRTWQRAGHVSSTGPIPYDALLTAVEHPAATTVPKNWPDLMLGGLRLETEPYRPPSGRGGDHDPAASTPAADPQR